MNAERTMQFWTALACLPPDDAAKELREPVCRCAPGFCEDCAPGIEVWCDDCGGLMVGSSAARAVRGYIDSERAGNTVEA